MGTVIKSEYEGDIRRFRLEKNACFEDLVRNLSQLYKLQGIFTIKYQDQENDLITLTTDAELSEARNQSIEIIRLQIQAKNKSGIPHTTDEISFDSNLQATIDALLGTPLLQEHITQLVVQAIKKEMIPHMAPLFENLAKVRPELVNENLAKEAIPGLRESILERDRELEYLAKVMGEQKARDPLFQSAPLQKIEQNEIAVVNQESPDPIPSNSSENYPQNSPKKHTFFPFISSLFNRSKEEAVAVVPSPSVNQQPEIQHVVEKDAVEFEERLKVISAMGFVIDTKVRDLVTQQKGDLNALISQLLIDADSCK